jgi:hypothetical protein
MLNRRLYQHFLTIILSLLVCTTGLGQPTESSQSNLDRDIQKIWYESWNFQNDTGVQGLSEEVSSLPLYYIGYYHGPYHLLYRLDIYEGGNLTSAIFYNADQVKTRRENYNPHESVEDLRFSFWENDERSWIDFGERNQKTFLETFEDYSYNEGKRYRLQHRYLYYADWDEHTDKGIGKLETDELENHRTYYRVLQRTIYEELRPILANYVDLQDYIESYDVQKTILEPYEDMAYYSEWDYEAEKGAGQIMPQPSPISKEGMIHPYQFPSEDIQRTYYETWDVDNQTGTKFEDEQQRREQPEYYIAYHHKNYPERVFRVDYYKNFQFAYTYLYRINLIFYFQQWPPEPEEFGVLSVDQLEDPTNYYEAHLYFYDALLWVDKLNEYVEGELKHTYFFTIKRDDIRMLLSYKAPGFFWNPFKYIDAVFHTVMLTERLFYKLVERTHLPRTIKRDLVRNGMIRETMYYDDSGKPSRIDYRNYEGQVLETMDYVYDDFGDLQMKVRRYVGEVLSTERFHYHVNGLLVRRDFYDHGQLRTYKIYHYNNEMTEMKEESYTADDQKMVGYNYTLLSEEGRLVRRDYYINERRQKTYYYNDDRSLDKIVFYNDFGEIELVQSYNEFNRLIGERVYENRQLIKFWETDENGNRLFYDHESMLITPERYHDL